MYATLVLLLLLPLQQDADEAYRQDYTKYTDITQIAEPAAQFDAFLAFMAEEPDARLESSILKGLQDNLTAVSGTGNAASTSSAHKPASWGSARIITSTCTFPDR